MSVNFFVEGEGEVREESINNYKDIFLDFLKQHPNLREALSQMFISSGILGQKLNELIEDILKKSTKIIEDILKKVQKQSIKISIK